jgi:hypothetical protein
MIKRGWMLLMILFVLVGFSGMAGASLTVIGTATYDGKDYNLIYEDDQGLIWLDYTNPSGGFGVGWYGQMKWAAGLNASGVLTYNFNPGISVSWDGDWRLPKTADGTRRYSCDGTTTAGFNITTSEMGHLFYKSLGNLGYFDTNGKPQAGWGLKNNGPFTKLDTDSYWSGTEYSIYPQHAWDFNMYFGSQGNLGFKSSYVYAALAVRPGRVIGR